jgi:hypothetical protein
MARVIPEQAPRRLSLAAAMVHRELKRIASDEVVARISYPIHAVTQPDFLVTYGEQRAFLISVSSIDDAEVERLTSGDLFSGGGMPETVEIRERHSLEGMEAVFLEKLGSDGCKSGAVCKWILFPRASDVMVERLSQIGRFEGVELLGRSACKGEALLARMSAPSAPELGRDAVELLRKVFSPETSLPVDWRRPHLSEVREEERRATQAHLFIDVDQEQAVKRALELSEEGQDAVRRGGLQLVTGVAGSGKTLVLLMRALLARRLMPEANLLVITHNQPLLAEMQARFRSLESPGKVEFATFYKWCSRHIRFEVAKDSDRLQILQNLSERSPLELPPKFLLDEFDWISDHSLAQPTLDWYAEVERKGRGRALSAGQREVVWRLYDAYRRELYRLGLTDWAGVPVRMLKALESGQIQAGPYDLIFIDEAQFFAPVWFACCKHALTPGTGRMFLSADPTQGFLRNGHSWLAVLGSEVRGRTTRLAKPYRNTREILEFASRFYRSRIPEDEDANLCDQQQLARMRTGPEPVPLKAGSQIDLWQRVLNEITLALESGILPENLLVIQSGQREVEDMIDLLSRRLRCPVVDAKLSQGKPALRVCTMNACTGIEASVVFVTGIRRVLEAEQSLHLESHERAELVRTNTKKLFVAFTRAQDRLFFEYHPALWGGSGV